MSQAEYLINVSNYFFKRLKSNIWNTKSRIILVREYDKHFVEVAVPVRSKKNYAVLQLKIPTYYTAESGYGWMLLQMILNLAELKLKEV